MVIHYAWVIAFTGVLVLLLAQGFGRMSYSVILPSMKEGLLLTYTQVGLIGTGNFIGYLSMAVAGGFLAVRFGIRKMIFISLLVMGISLFLTGISHSFTSAFIMRLITGMGNGGAVVPMMALTASWFAAAKRGFAAGILTMGTGLGLSIVGVALPQVIAKYSPDGWRYAWFLLGGLVCIFSFVCFVFVQQFEDFFMAGILRVTVCLWDSRQLGILLVKALPVLIKGGFIIITKAIKNRLHLLLELFACCWLYCMDCTKQAHSLLQLVVLGSGAPLLLGWIVSYYFSLLLFGGWFGSNLLQIFFDVADRTQSSIVGNRGRWNCRHHPVVWS